MKGNAGIPLSQPPYGYIKNPDDPRFWVIDPEAADVVRRIYDMTLEGYGLAEIANALGKSGIVNPTYYWRSKGINRSGSKSTLEPTKWGHTTVKKILTLQEYCGDVINFKSYSKSYKMKRRIENPAENRAIFLNVHEPIIDRATWEKVQTLQKGTRRKKPTVTQEPSVFSGRLKCPECGGDVIEKKTKRGISFYGCSNYPECNFMTWDLPSEEVCPKCGKSLFRKKGNVLYCPDVEGCGFTKPVPRKKKSEEN